jgi:hypothetical protein
MINTRGFIVFIFFGFFYVSSVFAGPFGIDMGMSLDKVKEVCKTVPIHIKDDYYQIIPPKTNDLFEIYIVQIDPTYGVYYIKAISKDIRTNGYGVEIRSTFDNLVGSIEKTYGKYKLTDILKSNSYSGGANIWTYALRDGDRELYAVWAEEYQSKLPKDIVGIVVWAGVTSPREGNMGYVVLEYYLSNGSTVKEKADSVF